MRRGARSGHDPEFATAASTVKRAIQAAFPPGQARPRDVKTAVAAIGHKMVELDAEGFLGPARYRVARDIDPGSVGGLDRVFTAGNNIIKHRAVLFDAKLGYAMVGFPGPEMSLGVAIEDAAGGEPVRVALSGVEDVEAAGPVQRGAYVEVVKGGRIAEAIVKPGYFTACLGLALGTATAEGQRVPVLISPSKLYG
jgi:hypothetical protein